MAKRKRLNIKWLMAKHKMVKYKMVDVNMYLIMSVFIVFKKYYNYAV